MRRPYFGVLGSTILATIHNKAISYYFMYTNQIFIFSFFSVALNALKRKKRLDKQLQQIDGTLSTIEFQREALENAQTNTEVLKNMSYAAKALKAAHQHL